MGRCAKCGSEVTGPVCQICGTPVQNNQFMGQPNQFGGSQPFAQQNQYGGQQPFGQMNQFGGPQPYRQPGKMRGVEIAGIILIILNAVFVAIITAVTLFAARAALAAEIGEIPKIDIICAVLFIAAHVLLAGIGVVMLTTKKKPAVALVMVILQAVLAIVGIIIIAILVSPGEEMDYDNLEGIASAAIGILWYLSASLISSVLWLASLILTIVATATNNNR
ncbi:MAG: hypothetical protein J1G06_01255 [Oscillospiraceae bacterium]|nr:hypothetical protein [Oscillospiraceae bacterium]